jgi:DNA-binding transcriptional LysR family regulator
MLATTAPVAKAMLAMTRRFALTTAILRAVHYSGQHIILLKVIYKIDEMELRQIEHVLAVVEHGSFTAAARSASIVQSALSTSIRNLERELGAPLFERTTRRVSLSQAGMAFLPAARRMLAESSAAADAVRAVAGLHQGQVAIGMIQWLGPVDLPSGLAAFHRKYPGIQISVWNATVAVLRERLRDGELDLAYLGSDEPVADDLVGRTVFGERLVLIMPTDHPLAGRARVRWAELAGEPFVELTEGSGVTTILGRVTGRLGLRRRIVGRVTQVEVQLALVRNGIGVAVVQETLARSTSGVAIAELAEPETRWTVTLVGRAPGPANPAAVALLEHLVPSHR